MENNYNNNNIQLAQNVHINIQHIGWKTNKKETKWRKVTNEWSSRLQVMTICRHSAFTQNAYDPTSAKYRVHQVHNIHSRYKIYFFKIWNMEKRRMRFTQTENTPQHTHYYCNSTQSFYMHFFILITYIRGDKTKCHLSNARWWQWYSIKWDTFMVFGNKRSNTRW